MTLKELDVAAGTTFQMRWGNSAALVLPETATDGSTWKDYALVTHMDSDNYLKDQSPHGHLGDAAQNQTGHVTGLIGDSRKFYNNDNRMLFPTRDFPLKNYSVSSWFYFTRIPAGDESFIHARSWIPGGYAQSSNLTAHSTSTSIVAAPPVKPPRTGLSQQTT